MFGAIALALGAIALAFGAIALALGVTTRPLLAELDYDAALHLYRIGELSFREAVAFVYPAHRLLYPVYAIAHRICGEAILTVRVVHALALAIAAVFLFATLVRATSRWFALLLVAAWLVCPDTLHLLRTLEDELVYLPWQAAMWWLCCRHRGEFAPRAAFVAGVLLGMAMLVHFPAVVWGFPFAYAALRGPAPPRALAVGLLGALFPAIAFGLVTSFAYGAQTTGDWAKAIRDLMAHPAPQLQLGRPPSEICRYLAASLGLLVSRWPFTLHPMTNALVRAAATLLGAAIAFAGAYAVVRTFGQRTHQTVHFTLGALILCSLPALVAHDRSIHERMVHLPFIVVTLIAQLASQPRTQRIAAVALLGVSLWSVRHEIVTMPRGQSSLAQLEQLSRSHPEACAFVFLTDEFEFHPPGAAPYANLPRLFAATRSLPNLTLVGSSFVSKIPVRIIAAERARAERSSCAVSSVLARAATSVTPAPP